MQVQRMKIMSVYATFIGKRGLQVKQPQGIFYCTRKQNRISRYEVSGFTCVLFLQLLCFFKSYLQGSAFDIASGGSRDGEFHCFAVANCLSVVQGDI